MGLWSVIKPEAAENLVTNPSFELDTAGYVAVGGTISRFSTGLVDWKFGKYALGVTPTAGLQDGVYYGTLSLTPGYYTFGVWFRGVAGQPFQIWFANSSGVLQGTPTQFTGTGRWQRVSVTHLVSSTGSYRVYVTKNNSASTVLFYLDGVQVVKLDHDTTYIDGDQPGCEWTGPAHASTSKRSSQERSGGREYFLDDLGVHVKTYPGLGMPPAKHHTLSQALLPGAKFLGRKVLPRTLILDVDITGTSHENMHELRRTLIDIIKPDLVSDDQPIVFRYYGADAANPLELHCVYDSGLESLQLDGFTSQPSIRFIAYDPFWYELGEWGAARSGFSVLNSMEYVLIARRPQYADADWDDIGNAMNGTVWAMASKDKNRLYLGGEFTNVGDANGDYIVLKDLYGGNFTSLGTGTNGIVRALAFGPDGSLYVGGVFTLAGGVANTARIARWDGTTWYPLSTGIGSGQVNAIAVGRDGIVYVGGTFTNHVDANGDYISRWNGTAWSSMSTGMNGEVNAILAAKDGSIYVAGSFTLADGGAANRIARWDGLNWYALGSGLNGTAYALAELPDGRIVVGGAFSSAGGNTANRIAAWNGVSWEALGAGFDSDVWALSVDETGLLYAGGAFTTSGSLTLVGKAAIWNGSTWVSFPTDFGLATVISILCQDDDVYVGLNNIAVGQTPLIVQPDNTGTAIAYPVIEFSRQAGTGTSVTLVHVRNEETGATVYLNHSLQSGETLTLDFRPGRRVAKSSRYGDVTDAILRGSDVTSFYLLPGTNHISIFAEVVGTPVVSCFVTWRNVHWSADGA